MIPLSTLPRPQLRQRLESDRKRWLSLGNRIKVLPPGNALYSKPYGSNRILLAITEYPYEF